MSMTDAYYGVCFSTVRYGKTVAFWCHSLSGDSTDSHQIYIDFPSEILAEVVDEIARWKYEEHLRTDKHTIGHYADVQGIPMYFPTEERARHIRAVQDTYSYFA